MIFDTLLKNKISCQAFLYVLLRMFDWLAQAEKIFIDFFRHLSQEPSKGV